MQKVLILILLDHALRAPNPSASSTNGGGLNPYFIGPCSPRNTPSLYILRSGIVLILILLDHALRVLTMFRGAKLTVVLILILLDHALRGQIFGAVGTNKTCLNPYFIGPCSPSAANAANAANAASLNPYFIGPCSPSSLEINKRMQFLWS